MGGEMGLRIIISVLLVISIFSPPLSAALTTFGKSNPPNQNQNPPPPPTPTGKARECRTDSDCAGIQNTTCVADREYGKLRCLCGDYTAPLNGACANKFKGFAECKNCQLDLPIINSHVVSEQINLSQRMNFNFDKFTIAPIFRSIKSLNRPVFFHPPYSHPAKIIRSLHSSCSSDLECIEDAQCVQRNSTVKRCYCREGFFEETPLFCNGCSSIFTLYTTTLLAASLVLGRLNCV